MKKKMGILGGLLMAVVVTGYSVAGTYAKYISSFDMADEARVATWRFDEVATHEVDLFQSSYTTNDGGIYVASKDADKVVAPGTSGSYKFNVKGTAETNFKVNTNIKIVNRIVLAEGLKIQESYPDVTRRYYNPIEFSFTGKDGEWFKAETPEYDETGKLIGFSADLTEYTNVVYPANYNLDITGEIYWRWVEETGTTKEEKEENNVLDTILATEITNKDLTLKATVGVTVEQTQDAPNYVEGAKTELAKDGVIFTTASVSTEDVAKLGIVTADYKDVVFTGTELKGSINKTTNDYTDRYMGTNDSKYYYPVKLTAAREFDTVTVTGVTNTTGTPGSARKTSELLLGLQKGTDVVYTLHYTDGTTESYTIKNSLTFNE